MTVSSFCYGLARGCLDLIKACNHSGTLPPSTVRATGRRREQSASRGLQRCRAAVENGVNWEALEAKPISWHSSDLAERDAG